MGSKRPVNTPETARQHTPTRNKCVYAPSDIQLWIYPQFELQLHKKTAAVICGGGALSRFGRFRAVFCRELLCAVVRGVFSRA